MNNAKKNKEQKINRLGEVNLNKYGSRMEIIQYVNYSNIVVQFDDNIKLHSSYGNFKTGNITSPHDKTVFNIGCLGEGKYKCVINKKCTECFRVWYAMLGRCYYPKYYKREPTYESCKVCDEWQNFQNFADWYNKNYYEVEGQKMQLDKDILFKGNKIYSSENCIIVPNDINVLFTKRQNHRGKYPIGVNYHKYRNKFQVSCNNKGRSVYLGLYEDPIKAFYVYKNYKEKLIKQIADEYKNKIPKKLYDALYKYKVEITD